MPDRAPNRLEFAAGAKRAALSRLGSLTGLTGFNLQLLESLRRPEWVYRTRGRLPEGRIQFRRPRAVTGADIVLSERLIQAYGVATRELSADEQPQGVWSWIVDAHQRDLAEVLERGDASALAVLLASMFRKPFVYGIAYGSLFRDSESRVGSRIWWLKTLDGLVSLAEALGVAPAENPEQGALGRALEGGVAELAGNIGRQLGGSIGFPDVGAPYGVDADGDLIPPEWPEQIYAATRLRDAVHLHLDSMGTRRLRLVEIGAGYGGLAYWFLRLVPSLDRYIIVDLPITNVLHGYFLSQALGHDTVSFFAEPPAKVVVLPNSAVSTIEPYEVLVNKDSFPEMPEHAMLAYLHWARATCGGMLYSYNQEATAEFVGIQQHLVPAAMQQVGGFRRLRRDCSWLRRGYVEEVYVRETGDSPVR